MGFNIMNLITEGTSIEGTICFDQVTRFEGELHGTLKGTQGTEIIIGNNGVIEGKIEADIVTIDGFVRGEIIARTKVTISGTGRVIGNIHSPNFLVQFGGYFDGTSQMSELLPAEL